MFLSQEKEKKCDIKIAKDFLKVLASEMDQTNSGLIRKLFIKRRASEIFS
jgi:hypothetical protein